MPAKNNKRKRQPHDTTDSTSSSASDVRTYNEMKYWDDRYKRHLAQETVQDENQSKKRTKSTKIEEEKEIQDDQDDITSEWYYSYSDLAPLLSMHGANRRFKQTARVLDIGCGLSQLFEHMIADGWKGEMLGIDYSPTVIQHLNQLTHPSKVQFRQMDARELDEIENERYQCVIDKATTDGLLCSEASAARTPEMYAHVARILAPGGLYVITSVNDVDHPWFADYVLTQLVEHGAGHRWEIHVHTSSTWTDGEETPGPNVFIMRKCGRALRTSTRDQSEPYTIEMHQH